MFTLSPTAGMFLRKYSTWFFLFIGFMAAIQPWVMAMQSVISPTVYGFLTFLIALAGILAAQMKQAGITPAPEVEAIIVTVPADELPAVATKKK